MWPDLDINPVAYYTNSNGASSCPGCCCCFVSGEKIRQGINLGSQTKYVHRSVCFMKHTSPEVTLMDHTSVLQREKKENSHYLL